MSDYYRSVIDHLSEFKNEAEMRSENDKSEQDNDSQTSTPSCVSKMDYTLPKYRNNVSPAIDKIMRMMNMPSLITSEDSSSDLLTSKNRIPSSNFCCGGNENVIIPIMAKECLDICFSSPKPFVSTCKKYSTVTDRMYSLFQDAQKPQLQEMIEPLPNGESEDPSNYEEKIYVSEVTFLLMASNRNQRMRDNVFQRTMPSRTNSRDSGFSELVEFVEETRDKNHEDDRDWQ
ncbi:hypothetical protein ALC56_02051 [Trachymyrmex septentrionalis]|uniref:Uncharacterized protein n=1 Tax=Trachymyrmex septentrionalis TaxID=34720 RepID=A0A195FTJ9_9HYME|nr:PREDICTED: uncharacterized protein LOC108756762 [Trachymyrmex septentrionalis]KYN43788.1 hypothetical protein ALC56_02051 [Trachymyrmex septentrionalis]